MEFMEFKSGDRVLILPAGNRPSCLGTVICRSNDVGGWYLVRVKKQLDYVGGSPTFWVHPSQLWIVPPNSTRDQIEALRGLCL